MKSLVANVLVLGGSVSVTAGCYLLAPWAALLAGGLIAGGFGVLLANATTKEGKK